MRTSDYVQKFFNTEGKLVDQNGLLLTLNAEFLLKLNQVKSFDPEGDNEGKIFERCLNEIRDKFSKIGNKVTCGLNEGLWRFFFANFLVLARDSYFSTYSRNKFINNKKKILTRSSNIKLEESTLNELAERAYEEYMSTDYKRKEKLSRGNKFLVEVCKFFNLKLEKLDTESVELKYLQHKDQLSISDSKGHEQLNEYRIILLTYIKYRDNLRK
jgi:hypothetical protein